jgi:hypothetical protein
MSRTWPEMFQHQVRVVVAERHTLARSSVSPHRQSVCDRNEVPKWAAPGLKCSSARCGSWWRRDTCSLDPPSPHTDSLSVTETRSRNEPHLAWNVPAPSAGRGGRETHASLGRGFCVLVSSALKAGKFKSSDRMAWKGEPYYIGRFKSTVVGDLTVGKNK